MKTNNVFRYAAYTGLLVVGVSLWMMKAGKVDASAIWMPEGFKVPVLALEFASSQHEIEQIVGSMSEEAIAAVTRGTHVDLLFLVVYNLFLGLVLWAIFSITRLVQYKYWSFLPLLVLLADAAENFQLFKALSHESVNMMALQLATWIKWLGLALSFTLVGRFLINSPRYYDRVLALSCFTTLPLGLWAMFAHNQINGVFAMLFYLLFPMMVIYTWWPGVTKQGKL